MYPRNKLLIFALQVLCLGFLCACTYHGQIRRGIYQPTSSDNRLDASVLVVSDQDIPTQITIAESETSSLYTFTLDVADGVAVAATDALSTLITYADAGPHTLEHQYELVAHVKLNAQLTRTNCEMDDWEAQSVRVNGLCTQLSLTLHRAGSTKPLGTFSAKRWGLFHKPGVPAAILWLNKHTFSLLSPVLVPGYTQLQGAALRKQFEQQLKEVLQDIVQQLQPQIVTWKKQGIPANK